jgi:hypothetical protein
MGDVLDRVTAFHSDPERGPSASHPRRRREDVFQDIKLALVVAELTLDEPRYGFDPYNARLGRSRRDVWERRRRSR